MNWIEALKTAGGIGTGLGAICFFGVLVFQYLGNRDERSIAKIVGHTQLQTEDVLNILKEFKDDPKGRLKALEMLMDGQREQALQLLERLGSGIDLDRVAQHSDQGTSRLLKPVGTITFALAVLLLIAGIAGPIAARRQIENSYLSQSNTTTIPVSMLPITNKVNAQWIACERDLAFQGGWKRSGPDAEMDSSGKDSIPVTAKTRLQYDSKRVWVEVEFTCKEYQGNGTSFSGWRTNTLVQLRDRRQIVALDYVGSNFVSFGYTNIGKNHRWTSFPRAQIQDTYWMRMGYVIDSPESNDSKHVGIIGRIVFQYAVQQ